MLSSFIVEVVSVEPNVGSLKFCVSLDRPTIQTLGLVIMAY